MSKKINNKWEPNLLDVLSFCSQIEDENLASLFKEMILSNPAESIKKTARSSYDQSFKIEKSKIWKCNHDNCALDSIRSHEISEKKIIKSLSKESNGRIVIDTLVSNLKENPYNLAFEEVSTKSATAFQGYCKDHDEKLFKDIDNAVNLDDPILLNSQFLRATKREIFELQKFEILFKSLMEQINKEKINSSEIKEFCRDRMRNARIEKKSFLQIYKIILDGLKNKIPAIQTKKYVTARKGYMFSAAFDLPKMEESDPNFVFLFKSEADKDNESSLYVGAIDNKLSSKIFNQLNPETCEGKTFAAALMLSKKDRFIFSPDFKNSLDAGALSVFRKDENLFPNPVDKFIAADSLF